MGRHCSEAKTVDGRQSTLRYVSGSAKCLGPDRGTTYGTKVVGWPCDEEAGGQSPGEEDQGPKTAKSRPGGACTHSTQRNRGSWHDCMGWDGGGTFADPATLVS